MPRMQPDNPWRGSPAPPDAQTSRLCNLYFWIGELVVENQRLRTALRDLRVRSLLDDQDAAIHRDALISSPQVGTALATTVA